jgi:hypothetical protein
VDRLEEIRAILHQATPKTLSDAEDRHIRTLRSLTARRRKAIMVFAESLAVAPEAAQPEARGLRLVVDNEG